MERRIEDHLFLVPFTKTSKEWMIKNFKKEFISTDGNPELDRNFYEGFLLDSDQFYEISERILEGVSIFKLNNRFNNVNDFLTDYYDGDVFDEDFIYSENIQ